MNSNEAPTDATPTEPCTRCGRAGLRGASACDFCEKTARSEASLKVEQGTENTDELDVALEKSIPWVSFAAFGICVFVFVFMQGQGGSRHSIVLLRFGANYRDLVLGHGEWWRTITSMFLHLDFRHLGSNMALVLTLGVSVEKWIGTQNYLYLYFLSGFGGSLLSLLGSEKISVGASGAILGVLGAASVIPCMTKTGIQEIVSNRLFGGAAALAIYNLILPLFDTRIDGWAHLGGFLAGCFFTICYIQMVSEERLVCEQTHASAEAEGTSQGFAAAPLFRGIGFTVLLLLFFQFNETPRGDFLSKIRQFTSKNADLRVAFDHPQFFKAKYANNIYTTIEYSDSEKRQVKEWMIWCGGVLIGVHGFKVSSAGSLDERKVLIRKALEKRSLKTKVMNESKRVVRGRQWLTFDGTSSESHIARLLSSNPYSGVDCLRAVCARAGGEQLILIEIYHAPELRTEAEILGNMIRSSFRFL